MTIKRDYKFVASWLDWDALDADDNKKVSSHKAIDNYIDKFMGTASIGIDETEKTLIDTLVDGLLKDKYMDEKDFNVLFSTINYAKYCVVGRSARGKLPTDMNHKAAFTGNIKDDMALIADEDGKRYQKRMQKII